MTEYNKLTRVTGLAVLMAAMATAGLAGCSKKEEGTTAGQKLDAAIATTEKTVDQAASAAVTGAVVAKEAVKDAAQDTAAVVKEAAKDTKDAAKTATTAVGDAMGDAAITTAVNAELTKDTTLSAIKIDVDTSSGRVKLSGTAPNAKSKERATELAKSVKGVNGVDNQLRVEGK